MDMKELNKSQLILLAILLSFVTSIATGITTVTLMQQAPVTFTAPVNRVIQQTVEKIQQVEGKTVTQTVVVKEEDLVVDALLKNKSAVFTINKKGQNSDPDLALGSGFVINKDGVIVTDANWVLSRDEYFVTNDSGKFKAEFLFTDKGGFSFLKIGEPVVADTKAAFTAPAFGDLSKLKIGQKIIILGNGISSFIFDGDKDLKISNAKQNGGGLVLNLEGEALGIVLSGDTTSFAPIDTINAAFAANPQ